MLSKLGLVVLSFLTICSHIAFATSDPTIDRRPEIDSLIWGLRLFGEDRLSETWDPGLFPAACRVKQDGESFCDSTFRWKPTFAIDVDHSDVKYALLFLSSPNYVVGAHVFKTDHNSTKPSSCPGSVQSVAEELGYNCYTPRLQSEQEGQTYIIELSASVDNEDYSHYGWTPWQYMMTIVSRGETWVIKADENS